MNEELRVLELVAKRLEQAGIHYMITGSIAMNYYATPRMTRDMDIVVQLQDSDASKFAKTFEDQFYLEQDTVLQAIREEGMFNIIHQQWVVKVDFIIRKSSKYRTLEFDRRRKVEVAGISLWIVSPEDLILSKLFWAKDSLSDFQLKDVRNILDSQEELDTQYIEDWIHHLDLQEIYKRIKK